MSDPTYPCPKNGCQSNDPDWCSECGAPMRAVAAPVPSPTGAPALAPTLCPDCSTPRDGDGEFCGVCRFNFETGQSYAPAAAAAPAAPAPSPVAAAVAETPVPVISRQWSVHIERDPALDPSVDPASLAPYPQLTFPLDLPEMLIGRANGRNHPEIPVDDEGVSSRHAKLAFAADGSLSVLDLASTNGTTLNGVALIAGAATILASGDQMVIGRWSRLTVLAR